VYVLAEDSDAASGVSTYNAAAAELTDKRVQVPHAFSLSSNDRDAEGNNAVSSNSNKIMAQIYLLRYD
jgi:hypothetical protein